MIEETETIECKNTARLQVPAEWALPMKGAQLPRFTAAQGKGHLETKQLPLPSSHRFMKLARMPMYYRVANFFLKEEMQMFSGYIPAKGLEKN